MRWVISRVDDPLKSAGSATRAWPEHAGFEVVPVSLGKIEMIGSRRSDSTIDWRRGSVRDVNHYWIIPRIVSKMGIQS